MNEEHEEQLQAARQTRPLFDSERYRRHLETAYQLMYERCLAGEAAGTYVETRFVCRGKSIINGAVRIQTRHTKQRGPGRVGRRIINISKVTTD